MQIGELSKRTGVSVRMLRYYEQQKLLKPSRLASGYRDYGVEEEETVRHIRRLGEAGLKLDVIRRFLPCVTGERPDFHPCPDLLDTLRREVSVIEDRIALLEESRLDILGYLERADKGS
ncbi:MerR family transcriptional regulator [Kushneria aurantia]|uniref:MerR family transcriptional regulator n=1 Tax=Kushneria aurantia TaxID=504092 RepID=A0ABV6G283_9GAMM|nr:MerR family transcriptional regulator [Kushneria aurantia]